MGTRKVTLQQIADKLGYSKNTISLALRNSPQIPQTTRDKIHATAKEMGYEANAVVSHLMALLRASQSPNFQAKLALLNAYEDRDAFRNHPTIPNYVAGCKRRAAHLGYHFDEFWLHDPELNGRTLHRILNARNIRGAIVVGIMGKNRLPEGFDQVWENYACVVTGVRTRQPTLSFACVDHHDLTLRALEHAAKLGYRRPALIVDEKIDQLVEGRFTAGFIVGHAAVVGGQHIPPLTNYRAAKANRALFNEWFQTHQPDIIFSLYNSIPGWIADLGLRVPQDVAFAQLERRSSDSQIAGMNQHSDMSGEAAVDMVISQIHNNEKGIPAFPRSTHISATWTDGESVREKSEVGL